MALPIAPTFPAAGGQANSQFDQIVSALNNLQQNNASQAQGKGDIPLANQGTFSSVLAAQNAVRRTSWIMSTTEWLSGNPQRGLVWAANPADISWQMAQRSAHSKNLFGTVLHVWPDNGRDTFYDELRLTLNLQSSNILPVRSTTDSNGWVVPPGIANFYDFMQLVDAPKLTSTGRANLVSIQYNSNLFPSLVLLGMFDSSGIKFTDSSSNPNQVNAWSIDFIVYDTAPRLTSMSSGNQSNSTMLQLWLQKQIQGGNLPR